MKKTWKQMKKWERRVAIARDVLKIIERPNIKTKQGTYFLEKNGHEPGFGPQVKPANECQVCAKGGLMLAFMEKTNFACPIDTGHDGVNIEKRLSTGQYERNLDDSFIVEALSGTFAEDQLDVIERCFEGWMYSRNVPVGHFGSWLETQSDDDIVEDYLEPDQVATNKSVRKFRKIKSIFNDLGMSTVEYFSSFDSFSMSDDEMRSLAESITYPNGSPAEGIVIRALDGSRHLNERISFKVINLKYKD